MDKTDNPIWGAVIVAAGAGSRFGGDIPKQFTLLAGEPVVDFSVGILKPFVDFLVVVTPPQDWSKWWKPSTSLKTVPGGERRQDSVMNGLKYMMTQGVTHVLIHDGARPNVDPASIKRVMEASIENAAVIPVIPVRDTLKRVSGNIVLETLNREELKLSQTPQAFHLKKLIEVLITAEDVTDEAAAFEAAGLSVFTVKGSRTNIKLTDREDAELLSFFKEKQVRVIGTGLDFHPFAPERPLYFCGCKLSETNGLMGHSDGDVVLHAVADAILSASRLGDIGTLFPPVGSKWKDADSSKLLSICVSKISEAGWKISRLDVTIIGERPKISPVRELLMNRLSEITEIPVDNIWIKGTTTNTIGDLAKGKGVGCSVLAELESIPRRLL